MSTQIPDRVISRARENVSYMPNWCVISKYSSGSHRYAQIGWHENGKTKSVLIHRLIWEMTYGSIPNGMTIDHICKNRKCINPDHLRLLSNFENARRTFNSDWEIGFCKNGHSNDYLTRIVRQTKTGNKRDGLACRMCISDYQRKYRLKKRLGG